MSSIADRVYQASPTWAQNILVSTYGQYWKWARFGGNYKTHEADYRRRDFFTQDEWHAYQNNALHDLLKICINQIPYYQETWSSFDKEAALNGNLSKLPLLTKPALRETPQLFWDKHQFAYPKFRFYTSGTTGTPISTTYTLSELRNSLALREVRSANWAGVSFFEPRATISGRIVVPDSESNGPFHRFNKAEKQVYFSAFHIKPENIKGYIEPLKKHEIRWMTGYAVSFYLLARFIIDQHLQVPPLKAIITTSEKLTSEMRNVIKEGFRCKVFEEYSSVENALFASECEQGRLHVSPDAGIIEILDAEGNPCKPGEIGEVVTTCLTRSYQPLIRFRIGDLAAWDKEVCPCGRSMPVLKEVIGRLEDVVVGPDGRQMVRFHGLFVNQPHVIEGQVIQASITQITIKIVPTQDFSLLDERDIVDRVQQRLGKKVDVNIEKVDHIPRTISGKFKAVISKVKN